jgi:hypothetical protein
MFFILTINQLFYSSNAQCAVQNCKTCLSSNNNICINCVTGFIKNSAGSDCKCGVANCQTC